MFKNDSSFRKNEDYLCTSLIPTTHLLLKGEVCAQVVTILFMGETHFEEHSGAYWAYSVQQILELEINPTVSSCVRNPRLLERN